MNTTEFLTIAAAICPDRAAILFEGRTLTFAQLNERSNRLASAMAKLGVKKGDRVSLINVNTPECVETYFATAKLGAAYVPLNFRARGDELSFVINSAEPVVLFVGQRYLQMFHGLKGTLDSVEHHVAIEGKEHGWLEYEKLVASGEPDDVFPDVTDEDTTILMYTAGTTGQPKGVVQPHKTFSEYVVNNVTPADPEAEEKNILTVPLYHVAGVQAVMSAVYGGRTVVMQRQFEPVEWMKLVESYKVDRAMMVPTMLKQLMDNPEFKKHNLACLKVITYGAAPMPVEVIKRAVQLFPHARFINAFGQTESGGTLTMLPPEDHDLSGPADEVQKKLKRLGSIGKPLSDVEVKVVDEMGGECPVGVVGEIVARGDRIMKGYWKQEEATKHTIKGGWLHTGDLAYRDEDGYLYLAGRSKDIIKRGGEMISPEEVEQCLMAHPAVDDAAIIGVPDVEWGERVRAVIVLKQGQKAQPHELIEFCRARLASYKKPESVVFTDELPRNPMGKVLKRVLREQFNQPITT